MNFAPVPLCSVHKSARPVRLGEMS